MMTVMITMTTTTTILRGMILFMTIRVEYAENKAVVVATTNL